MAEREIEIFIDYPKFEYDESAIQTATLTSIQALAQQFPDGDLSIAFLSDRKIAEIHGDFLDDPSETDVITFPGDPDLEFAGEICISIDRALEQATEHSSNLSHELTLYLVHGLLHLAGYKDKTDTESAEMRKGEKMLMNLLQTNATIPSFAINNRE